jgi:hypothetical protein
MEDSRKNPGFSSLCVLWHVSKWQMARYSLILVYFEGEGRLEINPGVLAY